MVACTHGHVPRAPDRAPDKEHPVVGVLAVVAIVLAILLIAWVRIEVLGTRDLESALTEAGPAAEQPQDPQIDEAVTVNRFATGLSP